MFIIRVLDLTSICLIPNIYIILHYVLLLTCSVSYLLFLLWIYKTLNKISISKEKLYINMYFILQMNLYSFIFWISHCQHFSYKKFQCWDDCL